jgi:hypothetical protein
MIVLLVIAAWIAVLSLIVGLCASARAGDMQLARVAGARGEGTAGAPWEAAEPVPIVMRAGSRAVPAGDTDVALARDSVAA